MLYLKLIIIQKNGGSTLMKNKLFLSCIMIGLVVPLHCFSLFNWSRQSERDKQARSTLLLKKAIENSDEKLFNTEFSKIFGSNTQTHLSEDKEDLLRGLAYYEETNRRFFAKKYSFIRSSSYLGAGLGLLLGSAYFGKELCQMLAHVPIVASLLGTSEKHITAYTLKIGIPLIGLSFYTGYRWLAKGIRQFQRWYAGDNYKKDEKERINDFLYSQYKARFPSEFATQSSNSGLSLTTINALVNQHRPGNQVPAELNSVGVPYNADTSILDNSIKSAEKNLEVTKQELQQQSAAISLKVNDEEIAEKGKRLALNDINDNS